MLLSIASSKHAWVAEMWEQTGEGRCWNPRFTRQIHDWELDEVETFFRKLQVLLFCIGIENKMVWQCTRCGKFFVKSM